MSFFLIALAWSVALVWAWRTEVALRNFSWLPDLLPETETLRPAARPFLSVIVPARNEEEAIEQTLRSLLAQQGVDLEILAVNDRSTDATGPIMEHVAASTDRIRVLHIQELPEGWMGKTHAMAIAARQANAPWLLFTDADVVFREDSLRRALAYAEPEADHLVLFPTLVFKNFGECMMLSAIQMLTFLTWRPWKIADPKSRESIGIGAFNLVRRETYDAIGGFEALPLEVLEDLRFGFLVKQHGFRQRFVLGRGLIRIHWAAGAFGIVRNLTKNIFAVFRFNPLTLLGACIALAMFCFVPLIAIWGRWPARVSFLLVMMCAMAMYRCIVRRTTGIRTAYVATFPVAACLILYALARSMLVTLARRGVVWRGTFYPLTELRKQAEPLR
ncbi:MAG TPA: glycosyltransferase [Pseudacidobacterium sp.]|nr:glycosyltransferase [Pseudacidobacterium sp.]